MSSAAARGNAAGIGSLRISQPEKFAQLNESGAMPEPSTYFDYSDSISVVTGYSLAVAEARAEHVRNEYQHDIRLGVGIGVGLGVPILVAVTAVLTSWLTKRSQRKHSVVEKI